MAIRRTGSVKLSEEEAAKFGRMEAEAVKDGDPEVGSLMIAMRWGRPQLRLVRRAAELRGVPYQVYIKNAAWEAAVKDLEHAGAVLNRQ
ncbi:MAG TPA: hypothetical protein VK009_01210 [Chloroflexota bacterium]|nr:hypothetical protein [Chloroflexota bacterium]